MSSHLSNVSTDDALVGRAAGLMPPENDANNRHESLTAGAEDNETPANNPPANNPPVNNPPASKKMKLTRAEQKADDDYDWDFAAQCLGDDSVNAERCLRSSSRPSGFHLDSRGIANKIYTKPLRKSTQGKAPRKQKE